MVTHLKYTHYERVLTIQASQIADVPSSNTLVAVSTPLEATLDIVAVHGMNVGGNLSHAEDTWTHDSTGVNWLRSLLPERLPSARILAFQYNANVAFGTSIAGVEEQANNLLECLRLARRVVLFSAHRRRSTQLLTVSLLLMASIAYPARPIIFIAHSLGGIIIKQALATAFREHEAYPMIWTFTYAIFFLAVPHRGSDHAEWGQVFADIHLTASLQPSNSFLESVRRNSNYNEELNARFEPLHEAYSFYSWIEALPLWPGGIIVPQDSATLGLPAPQERFRVAQRDHRTICKFSSAEDREWIELSATIAEAAHAATNSFDYSPTLHHRRAMFETPPPEEVEEEARSLLEASVEAQSVLTEFDRFQNGDELRHRQRGAEEAKGNISILAGLLLATLAPILGFLSFLPLLTLALAAIVSLLPSKERALEKVREGQEAEQQIMDFEAWAIERLNHHHREALRASHMLQRVISFREFDDQDDMRSLQLSTVRRKLLKQTEFITKNLHERHRSYNRAKAVWHEIEDVRREAASKDKTEFYITGARRVQTKINERDEGRDNDDADCCVIL